MVSNRPTQCRLIEMVFPSQTNHYGTLFGGQALALMDKAAFITASRYARQNIVTASSEKIDFHTPVVQGQLADMTATVISTGRTSLVVEVELHSENLLSGERRLCTKGKFVMVALNQDGKPVEIAPLSNAKYKEESIKACG